jgi:transposase
LLDNNPVSANSIGKYFRVNGSTLARQYKDYLSGFWRWNQLEHAERWVIFPDNLGEVTCIDEVALSDGELYTVVTNAKARCQKGSLVALIKGVRSDEVGEVLKQIPIEKRIQVEEVTLDLAQNMEKIARSCFPEATIVSDRFHVQQLPSEALQEMRIKFRWEAIEEENYLVQQAREEGKVYYPQILPNGDTKKQLLARSRYLLYKSTSKWTATQTRRAKILFRIYPDLKKAYELTMMFRSIYEYSKSENMAREKLNHWYTKVDQCEFASFITAANSISIHQETILAFFKNRNTNALAENFNSKIKAFRSVFRGISDVGFFIYRLSLILA